MNLKINRWRGGLCNNIMQIRNAIQVALYYDYNIIVYCNFIIRFFLAQFTLSVNVSLLRA